MDLTRIESILHEHLTYDKRRKWKYPPLLLFRLLIIKVYHKGIRVKLPHFYNKNNLIVFYVRVSLSPSLIIKSGASEKIY